MQIRVNEFSMVYEQKGQGLPVILVHGFPLDHTIWEPTVWEMHSESRIILPDLRGFGLSDAPQGVYTMQQMADDLLGLMDALGLEKAVLAGHSMGGYAALAFARAYPQRLAGFALICSHAAADTPEQRANRYAQAEEVLRIGPKPLADRMTPQLSADHQYHAEVYRIILRNKPAGLAGALQGMAERGDSTDLLPSIAVPSLVVAGQDDPFIPAERARALAGALPNAELLELPGAGHLAMMEKPVEVASALDKLVLAITSM
jgi:pimeloyl-ACP methyl ester carboxylesterase